MVKKANKARQQKGANNGVNVTDLLNFHHSTPPPPQDLPQHQSRSQDSNNHNNHRHHKKKRQNEGRRRSAQDRASARQKSHPNMFYLHASADHAFWITRRAPPSKVNPRGERYTWNGPDEPVSWEAVRLVKQLTNTPAEGKGRNITNADSPTCCPICLSDFVAPAVTKCGHAYCLPCILRHSQSSSANNPYRNVQCPCCAIPMFTEDLKPVVLECCLVAPTVNSVVKFQKLHRFKDCSAPYLPDPKAPLHYNPLSLPNSTDGDAKYSRFNYVDPNELQSILLSHFAMIQEEQQLYATSSSEAIFCTMAMEVLTGWQQQAMSEEKEEMALQQTYAESRLGMYLTQNQDLVYTVPATPAVSTSESKIEGCENSELAPLEKQLDEKLAISEQNDDVVSRRPRQDSICSQPSVGSTSSAPSSPGGTKKRRSKRGSNKKGPSKSSLPPGSMYLEEGSVCWYQSGDGQLVFLNGFNMNCLSFEFSKSATGTELPPLPDCIEAPILDSETIHMTPQVRKRMPFLSHLPLYADIVVVEVDLYPFLSHRTRQNFQSEFQSRKKKRQALKQAEQREDRALQKREQQQIEERKARLQLIDPNDEFFRSPARQDPVLTSDDNFGPALHEHGDAHHDPALQAAIKASMESFSQAARRADGGFIPRATDAFPALGEAFPALGEDTAPLAASPPKSTSGWSSASKNMVASNSPKLAPAPSGGKKKKGRGKKISLFSTGGHRG